MTKQGRIHDTIKIRGEKLRLDSVSIFLHLRHAVYKQARLRIAHTLIIVYKHTLFGAEPQCV